ncbi:trimeric intracellular cation channel family protein [Nesterenkonia halobia]|uniref:Trimeric intracellular cation channel family protein n=1 Tax=Nesterenkonia halobia TaxID=37922 RepID=A0ABP6RDZ6_9MICC
MPLDLAVLVFDLLGTFAFAISGALLAVQKGFDVVGSLLLASLTGLGGGVIRDLLLDQGVPNAFAEPLYLVPVVLAVLIVLVGLVHEGRLHRTLLVFDALGLATFCVMGATIAHTAGLNPVAAVLLGVTTAVGGGAMRDVVANRVPQIVDPDGVYATPTFLGAGLAVLLLELELFGAPAAVAVALLVFAARLLAVVRGWRLPLASMRPADRRAARDDGAAAG